MGKSKINKLIRRHAKKLPTVNQWSHEVHFMKGSQLAEEYGTKIMENGLVLEDEKIYKSVMPVLLPVNHNRMMKKQYYKNGQKGVIDYIESVGKVIQNQPNA